MIFDADALATGERAVWRWNGRSGVVDRLTWSPMASYCASEMVEGRMVRGTEHPSAAAAIVAAMLAADARRNRVVPTSQDLNLAALAEMEVVRYSDVLWLTCLRCSEKVCSIDAGDLMVRLATFARNHARVYHQAL